MDRIERLSEIEKLVCIKGEFLVEEVAEDLA